MNNTNLEIADEKLRDAFTTLGKIDDVDVKILEALSLLGPRNMSLIVPYPAKKTELCHNRCVIPHPASAGCPLAPSSFCPRLDYLERMC